MATSLERSQPHFTAIVIARKAIDREKFAKLGRAISEIIGVEPLVQVRSSFGS